MKQLRDGFNMELKFARLRRYLGRLAFIAELHAHAKRSPIAKKIWLSVHPRNVGPSAPQGNQCKISCFLPSVGACNLILQIHVLFS